MGTPRGVLRVVTRDPTGETGRFLMRRGAGWETRGHAGRPQRGAGRRKVSGTRKRWTWCREVKKAVSSESVVRDEALPGEPLVLVVSRLLRR